MRIRFQRIVGLLMAVVLVASGCSSDSDGDGVGVGSGSTPDASATSDGLEAEDVAEAAAAYVGDFGDEGAFAAVLIAVDRGYAVDQLVPVVDLTADGTVPGTEPARGSGGLVDMPTASEDRDGGSAERDEESMGVEPRVRLVGQDSASTAQDTGDELDPTEAGLLGLDLTIGEVQRQAAAAEYLEEMGIVEPSEATLTGEQVTVEGYQLVVAMMMLAARGYSGEQIVTALISDTVRTDSALPACLEIPGEAPAIEVVGVKGCPSLSAADADNSSGEGGTGTENPEPTGNGTGGDDATALDGIPTGIYEGTVDTSTGGFRTDISIDSAQITLQYANGGVLIDWNVSWTEDAGECVTTGTDSWSGSEVTVSDARSFSIRGTRRFEVGSDSTCDLGAEPSSFSRVLRFEVEGSTVTSDIGLGIATIEIGS